jgi:C4-dicarboxylate-specific signal transduction histidine kinase
VIIPKGQTLQRQIVVATSILLLALIGGALWSGNRTRLERQDDVRAEASSVATLAAAYLNQYFDGLDAIESALVRHPAVTSLDAADCRRVFADLIRQQPLLLNVTLRDRAGALIASGVEPPAGQPTGPLPESSSRALATGQPAVGRVRAAPITGRPTINQAYPVHDSTGSVVGVLAFGLNLIQLQTVFGKLPLPDGSVVTLQDEDGRLLARSRDSERYIGSVQSVAAASGPALPQVDVDGVDRFVGWVKIDRGPWMLGVGIPRSVVVDRLAPLYLRNIIILTCAAIATLGLALWLSRHISSGLNRLRVAAVRISEGDLSPPAKASSPSLEILQLQDAFGIMATNLRDARGALARQIEQERKTSEMLQSIQRQLVRQERLAAVGLLASGVAHELNNPLQAILGTAEILERHASLPPAALEEIALLKTQSGRARDIIRNLSRFSSPQLEPPALIDLRTVVDEVIQLKRRDLEKAGIMLSVESADTHQVYANMTEIEQVTLNLVINAQQSIQAAGRSAGRIVIRVYEVAGKVRLEVHDNGTGVLAEDEAKLFQPFFTTKPVGEGTGLGLSVSYGIIDSYGGTIGHRGNEWHGATFFYELPAVNTPEDAAIRTSGV